MEKAKVYYDYEVMVKENGKTISLKEWVQKHTNLVWTDIECLIVFENSNVGILLDECNGWDYVNIEDFMFKKDDRNESN